MFLSEIKSKERKRSQKENWTVNKENQHGGSVPVFNFVEILQPNTKRSQKMLNLKKIKIKTIPT